jgi:ABC-type uncharacterized transport system involved in gliding motility auxiliary subunit
MIHQVAWPKRPVLGILDTLNLEQPMGLAALQGGGGNSPLALEQIHQLFDVRALEKDLARMPDDLDVLLLIQPVGLSDRTRYAIDQFVLGGGRVLIFLDPVPEESGGGPAVPDEGLERLLAAWGVSFDPSKVAGDLQLARKVQYNRGGRATVADHPGWITVPAELMDGDDMVTADLGSLNLATAGHLSPTEDAKTSFTPLFWTTENAALIDAARLGAVLDLQEILRDYRPTGARYTLAARVTGPVTSAFPDGPPKTPAEPNRDDDGAPTSDAEQTTAHGAEPSATAPPAHLDHSAEPANILMVADTDLLQDRFWVDVQNLLGLRLVAPNAANGSLMVNAVENLSGDNDMISVRNRGQFSRPFTKVEELRQGAERQFRAKERELLARLDEAEQRLAELERGEQGSPDALILSAAQQQELERFRQEKLRIRKELREVRRQLRRDIEGLESGIKFLHIGLIPLAVAGVGIWLGLRRTRRRQSAAPDREAGRSGGEAHA